jgi:hypothetical protein
MTMKKTNSKRVVISALLLMLGCSAFAMKAQANATTLPVVSVTSAAPIVINAPALAPITVQQVQAAGGTRFLQSTAARIENVAERAGNYLGERVTQSFASRFGNSDYFTAARFSSRIMQMRSPSRFWPTVTGGGCASGLSALMNPASAIRCRMRQALKQAQERIQASIDQAIDSAIGQVYDQTFGRVERGIANLENQIDRGIDRALDQTVGRLEREIDNFDRNVQNTLDRSLDRLNGNINDFASGGNRSGSSFSGSGSFNSGDLGDPRSNGWTADLDGSGSNPLVVYANNQGGQGGTRTNPLTGTGSGSVSGGGSGGGSDVGSDIRPVTGTNTAAPNPLSGQSNQPANPLVVYAGGANIAGNSAGGGMDISPETSGSGQGSIGYDRVPDLR